MLEPDGEPVDAGDPAHGDDRHTGLSKDQAWKSFHPLERITLAPGDRIDIFGEKIKSDFDAAGRAMSETLAEGLELATIRATLDGLSQLRRNVERRAREQSVSSSAKST